MRYRLAASAVLLAAASGAAAQADLNGTWDNGDGIEFLNPASDGASICVVSCDEIQPDSRRPLAQRSRPVYKPEFQAVVNDLHDRQVEEDPVLRCLPPGVPRIGPPDKIVQTDVEVIFMYEDVSGNFARIIPIDGRGHRSDIERSYLGDAIGRWEDDTLVVETVHFNEDTWLTDDGAFHTLDLRVVERVSRDGDELSWDAIVYDPAVLTEPWDLPVRYAYRTSDELVETPPCIERDLDHIVDGTHHDNTR